MNENPFEMTEDVNGKPVPRWHLRLEAMYTEGVPFGEILGYVRSLVDESAVNHILNMADEAILAATPDVDRFAAEMRQKFDVIARLTRENAFLREWLRGELTISDADIDAALTRS